MALRSPGGVQSSAPGFPALDDYRVTAEADHAPYLKTILASLPFSLQVVRVLWLPPGGVIESHFDFDTNLHFGLVRLHIPLQTSDEVEFVIAGERIDMRVGEFWYGDFSLPHHVSNRGGAPRLHAVLDAEVGEELLALLPPDYVAAQAAVGPISKTRCAWPPADDLSGFECSFFVPGNVLPLLVMGRLADLYRGARASVRRSGDALILDLDDAPHCRLQRVDEDEFAIQGMPPGCFFRFRRQRDTVVSAAALVVRGVQENLAAARVGVAVGDRISEREIPLPLMPHP